MHAGEHGDTTVPMHMEVDKVSPIKIAAIVLLVAGTLGLVYGGFT